MDRATAAARTWGQLVRRVRVFALATSAAAGSWSTPLFFAADEAATTLYFITSPSSRHAREGRRRPRCSGSLWAPPGRPDQLRGAQFEGRLVALKGGAEAKARACFLARHPAAAERIAAATGERFFALELDAIKVTDNRLGFGWKELLRPRALPAR